MAPTRLRFRVAMVALCVGAVVGCATVSDGGQAASSSVPVAETQGPDMASFAEGLPSVPIPTTIDATGRTDVAVQLQDFIDGVSNGSVIQFPEDAVYRIGEALHLDDRRRLVLQGNDTTLRGRGCDVGDSLIAIGRNEPSSRIGIQGFSLEGSSPRGGTPRAHRKDCQFQMGVAIYQSRNVDVSNVSVSNVNGDCLYVGGSGSPVTWSEGVSFRDSVCKSNGRMGVAIVAGRDVSVERVDFDDIAILVFDIEPNVASGGARNVSFKNNTIGSFGHSSIYTGYFFAANGNGSAVVDNVVISGNVVNDGTLKTLIEKPNRRNIVIRNNTAHRTSSGPVMKFYDVNGITVAGNDQPLSSGELARFTNCTNVTYDG